MSVRIFLVVMLVCSVSACGNKGGLKTPAQAEAQEIKKAKKEAEKQKETTAETLVTDRPKEQ